MNKIPSDLKTKLTKQQDQLKTLEDQMGSFVESETLVEYFQRKYALLQGFLEQEEPQVQQRIQAAKEEKAAKEKERHEQQASEKAAAEKAVSEKIAAQKAAAAERIAAEKARRAEAENAEKASEKASNSNSNADASVEVVVDTATPRVAESGTVVQLAAQDKLVGGQKFQLELERSDAKRRIIPNPSKGMADLTDDDLVDTWIKLRDDQDSLNWMMMGYAEGSGDVIKVIGRGEGGFQEMKAAIPDEPVYMYIRYLFGDTGRSKFVFLTYVPDTLAGLKKAKVVQHRPAVTKFVKYFQIEWHVLRKEELAQETLEKKLLAAGGANYSVQQENKGDFKSYKGTTATFHGVKQ